MYIKITCKPNEKIKDKRNEKLYSEVICLEEDQKYFEIVEVNDD